MAEPAGTCFAVHGSGLILMASPWAVHRHLTRQAPAWAFVCILVSLIGLAFAEAVVAVMPPRQATSLERVERWVTAARRHQPGRVAPDAGHIARWTRRELERVLTDVKAIRRMIPRVDLPPGHAVSYGGGYLTTEAAQRLLGLKDDRNDAAFYGLLRRAAMMHADIAMLVPPVGIGQDVLIVADGQFRGYADSGRHWAFGRTLLAELGSDLREDPVALLWYRAAAAVMHSGARWADSEQHLAQGLSTFPRDPWLLFFGGALNESLAATRVQAARFDLPPDVTLGISPPAAHLARAASLFRQALEQAPQFAEARIRLGRVLGLQGHHAEAVRELDRARSDTSEALLLYYAELFLAGEQEALSDADAAQRHYQRAAMHVPGAQAPHLGVSLLARRDGDRAGALAELRSALERATTDAERDPWSDYLMTAGRYGEGFTARLRALFAQPLE